MVVRFEYKSSSYLNITDMCVIGSFNDFQSDVNRMEKSEDCWYTEISLPPGEHRYKFLINNEIMLNDPAANMYLPNEEEELWSAIIINENGERLYNNEQYTVNVENYAITNMVTDVPAAASKKCFNLTMDKAVVSRFEFNQVTGLHAVTAVWYDSRGNLHSTSENILCADEEHPEESVLMWFWIDLNDTETEYPEGLWSIKLFIDGSFVLEDQFKIVKEITYSSTGQFYHI